MIISFLHVLFICAIIHCARSIQCYAANATLDQKDLPGSAKKISCDGCDFCVQASYNINDTNRNKYTQTQFWDCGCEKTGNQFNSDVKCTEPGITASIGNTPTYSWNTNILCCKKDYCNSGGLLVTIQSFLLLVVLVVVRCGSF